MPTAAVVAIAAPDGAGIRSRRDTGREKLNMGQPRSAASRRRPRSGLTTPAVPTAVGATALAATVTAAAAATTEPLLVILEPPSPKYLKGKTNTQHSSREVRLQPEVNAGGVSVGGVGLKTTKDKDVERSWRFQSHWANNELGLYTNAQWAWKAVAENPDIEDVGALVCRDCPSHDSQRV